MVTYKITNEEQFSSKLIDVDTSGLRNRGADSRNNHLGFYGELSVESLEMGEINFWGDFGAKDYETIYGFILITKK